MPSNKILWTFSLQTLSHAVKLSSFNKVCPQLPLNHNMKVNFLHVPVKNFVLSKFELHLRQISPTIPFNSLFPSSSSWIFLAKRINCCAILCSGQFGIHHTLAMSSIFESNYRTCLSPKGHGLELSSETFTSSVFINKRWKSNVILNAFSVTSNKQLRVKITARVTSMNPDKFQKEAFQDASVILTLFNNATRGHSAFSLPKSNRVFCKLSDLTCVEKLRNFCMKCSIMDCILVE